MKRNLTFLLILILIFSLLATTSCKKAESSNVLNWNLGADPKYLDPGLNGASDGGDVIMHTFEGLVNEVNGEILPGVAESWQVSPDNLTYTFKLRKTNWSDGTPLTAHDFEYAWKRVIDPQTASEYAWLFEYTNIVGATEALYNGGSLDDVGVQATDDYTLEVTLHSNTPYFLGLTSFYTFKPVKKEAVESAEEGAWAKKLETAICNGAFKLAEYTAGDRILLEKNEEYWDKENTKIEQINIKMIEEESTAYTAYENNEFDALSKVPTAEIARLKAEDPNFYIFPLLGTYYYNINLKDEIFNDVNVRKALAYAIDRQAICDALQQGNIPATGFTPPNMKDAEGNDFNETAGTYGIPTGNEGVEEAKQAFADAGFPNGEGFPEITIMYNTSEGHKLVAEIIQEMWKTNLNIDVQLENQEWAVFQDTRKEGNYQIARGGWITDYDDPMGLLSIFTSTSAYNDPKYFNETFDKLISEANPLTAQDRYDKLYEAQEVLAKDFPIIPIYYYTDNYLIRDNIQGWGRSVLGTIDFTKAELK